MPFANSASAAQPQLSEPSKRLALEAEGHALAEELSSFVDEVSAAFQSLASAAAPVTLLPPSPPCAGPGG